MIVFAVRERRREGTTLSLRAFDFDKSLDVAMAPRQKRASHAGDGTERPGFPGSSRGAYSSSKV
jgi:hypothetical protein